MKNKEQRAFDLVEKELINTTYFDETNFYRNKKTVKIGVINFNYYANFDKCKKLSKKVHKGFMVKQKGLNKGKEQMIFPTALAFYVPLDNRLSYIKDKSNVEILAHETIHMSSTNERGHTGFSRTNHNSPYIFRSDFNEGATQWLTCKIVHGNDEKNRIYPIETRIARMLEIAVGEAIFVKNYSQANFKKMNQQVSTNKAKFPIRNVANGLDDFLYLDRIANIIANDLDASDKVVEKVVGKYLKLMDMILKSMQRTIIDIYFMNESNISDENLNITFMDTLITHDVTNDTIFNTYAPILNYNYEALDYYKIQLKKHNKELYNSMFKTLVK